MARINLLEQTERKAKKQSIADADYLFFEDSGERLFQLVSYGSRDREFPESASQTIQFDKQTAEKLIAILKTGFQI
ncbi:hypothetical protein FACS189491_11420 [Spirochaetia bacterium]|nr:hypothetical protein FACS189491_11420 [Spirochaetia bacterium]